MQKICRMNSISSMMYLDRVSSRSCSSSRVMRIVLPENIDTVVISKNDSDITVSYRCLMVISVRVLSLSSTVILFLSLRAFSVCRSAICPQLLLISPSYSYIAHVYHGCLVWYDVLLILCITQAWNTANWGIYKIPLYSLFIVTAIFLVAC